MSDLTGPERVRAAIERDRGGHAPTEPVILCGTPDPHAMRADDPRWSGNQPPPVPKRSTASRMAEAVTWVFVCPGCISLRFGPGHLTRKLAGIDCRNP